MFLYNSIQVTQWSTLNKWDHQPGGKDFAKVFCGFQEHWNNQICSSIYVIPFRDTDSISLHFAKCVEIWMSLQNNRLFFLYYMPYRNGRLRHENRLQQHAHRNVLINVQRSIENLNCFGYSDYNSSFFTWSCCRYFVNMGEITIWCMSVISSPTGIPPFEQIRTIHNLFFLVHFCLNRYTTFHRLTEYK